MTHIDHVQVAERALFGRGDLVGGENNIGPPAVRRHDDADAMSVAFFRRRPFDLANLSRLSHIADIENDHALIAVGEIGAIFIGGYIVQRNPDLRQPIAQTAVVDPVLTDFFAARGMLAGKPPARDFFWTSRVVEIDNHENGAKITFQRGRDERELALLRVLVQPETVDTTVGRDIGFEEAGFTRFGRIGNIKKSDARRPGLVGIRAQAFLIDHEQIPENVDILTLHTRIVFDLRDHARFRWVAHFDDAEALIVRYVSMFAIFADAKLSGLVPAVEIGVGENREILHFAVAGLPLFGAAEYVRT